MMKPKSSLDQLPADIKSELIEKILTGSATLDEMTHWLANVHGQNHSRSAIHRFSQTIKLNHGGLIDLGISPKTLADHADQLEKLGILLVQREVLNRQIDALVKSIFDVVDESNVS